MRQTSLLIAAAWLTLAAGCNQPITVPHIAETLGPSDTKGAPAQQEGFGQLPAIAWVKTPEPPGVTNISTDLPSLQPTVNVLRIPSANLKLTEFQNLTQAIGMPAGLIGDNTRNQGYTLNWTNQEGYDWQFLSDERKLAFNLLDTRPRPATAESWVGQPRLVDAAGIFLKTHGIDERTWRDIQIIPRWQAWLVQLDKLAGCVPLETKNSIAQLTGSADLFHEPLPNLPTAPTPNCVTAYPAVIPLSFERLVDGAAVVDKDGTPEYGGQLVADGQAGNMVSGWMTLPADPQRSDYPAITQDEMRTILEQGGLAGPLSGVKDLTGYTFALTSLPKQHAYDDDYLVPSVVCEGTRTTDGGQTSVRVVVPLVKQ